MDASLDLLLIGSRDSVCSGTIDGAKPILDADKNGRIDVQEIKVFFQQVGYPLSDNEVLQLIKMYDKNNSGVMEFDEFASFYRDAKSRF